MKRAPAPASIDDARLVDRGRAGRRDVHEVERLRELAARRDADEDAARGEGVGEERIAVVGVLARRAQERERRLRVALEQGREVDDLEARGRAAVGEPRVEAAVDEHDAARARDRQQPRRRAPRGSGRASRRRPRRRTRAMRA